MSRETLNAFAFILGLGFTALPMLAFAFDDRDANADILAALPSAFRSEPVAVDFGFFQPLRSGQQRIGDEVLNGGLFNHWQKRVWQKFVCNRGDTGCTGGGEESSLEPRREHGNARKPDVKVDVYKNSRPP